MALIPVMRCRDMRASVEFYTRILGFTNTLRFTHYLAK